MSLFLLHAKFYAYWCRRDKVTAVRQSVGLVAVFSTNADFVLCKACCCYRVYRVQFYNDNQLWKDIEFYSADLQEVV